MRILAVFLAGLLLSSAAQAQLGSGPYIGIGYGVLEMEDDGSETGIGFSDTAASYRLFGGYHIHETLALEVGFGKSGDFHEELVAFAPGVGTIELDLTAEYDVSTLRVLAVAPFDGIDMFGGIGFFDADVRFTARFSSAFGVETQRIENSASGGTIVGGVQFHLDRFIIRGEYEWFDDDIGIGASALNIALILPFNR
jgi:opacity protein-like surface antigen